MFNLAPQSRTERDNSLLRDRLFDLLLELDNGSGLSPDDCLAIRSRVSSTLQLTAPIRTRPKLQPTGEHARDRLVRESYMIRALRNPAVNGR